jgi:hypothetical protein
MESFFQPPQAAPIQNMRTSCPHLSFLDSFYFGDR